MIEQTMSVDYNTLVGIISQIVKGDFVYVDYTSLVQMNKGGRQGLNTYYGKVFKNVKSNVRPLTDYVKRVNNNRIKEENDTEFVGGKNKVGEYFSPCVSFNEKLNKHYFKFEFFEGVKVKVEYTYNGDPIEKQLFESYMISRSTPTNQELDKTINVSQLYIGNINEITINKTKYKLIK
jgi:hypothetical protein